jgi:homoserine kinase
MKTQNTPDKSMALLKHAPVDFRMSATLRFMPRSVSIRVPATSANLGSGFDSLGLALAITEEITLSLFPAEEIPGGLGRLVVDAAKSAYRAAHQPVPDEISASGRPSIPVGRGLGASAAARAAGIVGANALMGGPLSHAQMLTLGANLEGHADNMAPALFGGLRVVVRDGDQFLHLNAPIARGLKVVLFVPDFDMPTNESRKLLPQQLSKDDAVHNIGRAAMLVAALAAGAWELLDAATQDRMHQPARTQLFPAMPAIFDAAKEAGAHAAYLSGGGSTIAAFATTSEDAISAAMAEAAKAQGYSGHVRVTEPSDEGALVISSS